MQYALNISIDDAGIKAIIAAGQTVTIVKSADGDPLRKGLLPVAWLAFAPAQANAVTWTEDYFMYATSSILTPDTQIVMSSQTTDTLQIGKGYVFSSNTFSTGQGTQDCFKLTNSDGATWTFGLAQSATVNGTAALAPLNAVPVMNNESAVFIPKVKVAIFLSSASDNGTVITDVASEALVVELSTLQPSAAIGFDDGSNTFRLNNSAPPARRT
jgi:hypothetical protein